MDLESAGLGTVVATGATWAITRILSHYRRKTVKLANVKPAYISFIVSVIVVMVMHWLKVMPGDLTVGKAIIQIFTATLMSGGIQANINDFRGKTGASSHMLKGVNPEAYADYNGSQETIIVGKGNNLIEQYVRPNFYTKVLVEKILPLSLRGRSLRAIDILCEDIYKYYEPDQSTMRDVCHKSPRGSADLLENGVRGELSYLEYILLEHAAIATLFGSDYVRTIYCDKDIFNVFYYGDAWRLSSSGDEYNLDYGCTMISHRGVLVGSAHKLKIKKAKYKDYKSVDDMLKLFKEIV